MKEKFLPIGTVILLKDATKRIMITGYCSATPDEPDKVYDYVGCLFPEGNLAGEDVALFNHTQIYKIFHMGLEDDEFNDFNKNVKELINQEHKENAAEEGKVNLGDKFFGSGRLDELPPFNGEFVNQVLNNIRNQNIAPVAIEPTPFEEPIRPDFSKETLKKKAQEAKLEVKEKTELEKMATKILNSQVENSPTNDNSNNNGSSGPVLKLDLIGSTPTTLKTDSPNVLPIVNVEPVLTPLNDSNMPQTTVKSNLSNNNLERL